MTRLQALGDISIIGIVAVVPQVASALIGTSVHTAAELPPPSLILAANSMIWATVAAVAIYLTYRSGQPLSSIGFRRENPLAVLGAAILATVAIFAAVIFTAILMAGITHASRDTMMAPAREIYGMFGLPSWGTIFTISAAAGLFEEILFRGFLLTRLRVILGGWTPAIILGMVLFAAPHIWEGRWAVVLILPIAMVLSITFLARRSLAAPILAHFLFNFLQLAAMRTLQSRPEWQQILHPGG